MFRLLPVDHHVDATFLAKKGRFLVTVPAEQKKFLLACVFFLSEGSEGSEAATPGHEETGEFDVG